MRLILILAICAQFAIPAIACTTFKSPFGSGIARNVDWFEKYPNTLGILVMNPSGMKKVGLVLGAPVPLAKWTSKWKSVGFSIAGAEFPNSGFNEAGLSMEILALQETQYPSAQDPRSATGAAQFVQYNLDVATTIDDVIAADQSVRPFSSFKMHYFVCDAREQCAVLQYIQGKLQVYRDENLPYAVLTNSLYPASVKEARSCSLLHCQQSDDSLKRFARASLLKNWMNPLVPFTIQAKEILDQTAQNSTVKTRFQVIYDSKKQEFHFKKKNDEKYLKVKIDFSKLQCEIARPSIVVSQSLQENQDLNWMPLTRDVQFAGAIGMGLPIQAAHAYADYPFQSVSCQ